MDEVTAAERDGFLKRQGWREDMMELEKKALEECWPDHAIRMALDLNLA